jgi:hypothetical protein
VIELKDRWNGGVIVKSEAATVRDAVIEAVESSADLRYADLRSANLSSANLRSANLRYADLSYANLRYANLSGSTINWNSHALISELLLREAGKDVKKRKLAGLVLVSPDWCWGEFLALRDPLRGWALKTLAAWVQDGDNAPDALRQLVKKKGDRGEHPLTAILARQKERAG